MRPLPPMVFVAAVALLGACGMQDGSSGSTTAGSSTPPPSSSTSAPTDADRPTVPLDSGGKVRLLTVTGSVSDGVESGCLLLTPTPSDANGPWMLMGKVAGIKAGQQVTVRGYRVEDVASTCQQGRPFKVEAVVTS